MSDCSPNMNPYRVVRTIAERNTIPCDERINGMRVTVVGGDSTYKEYMLKGGDPCVNSNWEEIPSASTISQMTGHSTVEEDTATITDLYLNERFPDSLEGYRVTFLNLKSTFMKISADRWVITNNILN